VVSESPRSLTSYKSLSVYVTDRNDNAPTFTSQVQVSLTSQVSVYCRQLHGFS